MVRQLAAQCGEAGKFLHWGATTQDIMGTAVVLQVRAALALVESDFAELSTILARHAERLQQLKPRVLVGQFAGAAGTLASLGERGLDVQKSLMEEPGLGQPAATWHSARDGLADAVMMGIAPYLGRNAAHDVVYDACREVTEKGGRLADALAKMPDVARHLDQAALEKLTDPANYLGAAQEMVDRVIGGRG